MNRQQYAAFAKCNLLKGKNRMRKSQSSVHTYVVEELSTEQRKLSRTLRRAAGSLLKTPFDLASSNCLTLYLNTAIHTLYRQRPDQTVKTCIDTQFSSLGE